MKDYNLNSLNPMKFLEMGKKRAIAIANASSEKPNVDKAINRMAKKLHPKEQYLLVKEVIEVGPNAKKYILEGETCAYFKAGQYLTITINIDGNTYSRPYSLISSPKESLDNIYSIMIKRVPDGIVSNYILDNWQIGTKVITSDPQGFFTYEELRDAKSIIGVAGGSGITPFISLAKAIKDGDELCDLTILYGSRNVNDILLKDELDDIVKTCPKVQVVYVLSDEEKEGYEHGFISLELIKKYQPETPSSIFICGPEQMHTYLDNELSKLDIEKKYIRHEVIGSNLLNLDKKLVQITVIQNGESKVIAASTNDTILQSLEKNGIKTLSRCRSGECGFCHSRLISGDVHISLKQDRRRKADEIYGYLHPCCTYPLTNIVIEIPN